MLYDHVPRFDIPQARVFALDAHFAFLWRILCFCQSSGLQSALER
jgi:hypothetical protein